MAVQDTVISTIAWSMLDLFHIFFGCGRRALKYKSEFESDKKSWQRLITKLAVPLLLHVKDTVIGEGI